MAITQITRATPDRAYYQPKRAAGKSHKEALGCLKSQLSDVVYQQFFATPERSTAASPGGHSWGASQVLRGRLTPRTGASDKSLPELTAGHSTTRTDSAT
nr:hypothetical protein GCM10017611_02920 [Rhodococcus wratislaviensis]